MGYSDKSFCKEHGESMSQWEFFDIAGISPELKEFVNDFIQKPEIVETLSIERRREIEAQMDAVLSLFG